MNENGKLQINLNRAEDRAKVLIAIVLYTLGVGGSAGIGSSLFRVDKFGRTDFELEAHKAHSEMEKRFNVHMSEYWHQFEERIDKIEQLDSAMLSSVKACQENYSRLNRRLEDMQGHYWRNQQ